MNGDERVLSWRRIGWVDCDIEWIGLIVGICV